MYDAGTLYHLDRECRSLGGLIGRSRRDGKPTDEMERRLAVARINLAIVNAVVTNGVTLTEAEAEQVIALVRQGVAA